MSTRDGALVAQADTHRLPLADKSVDLIVTSPPYFAQRSYKDGGEHFDGQIGDEATPQEWLGELWKATEEWWRVLKDEGSAFVNLGDKRSGSGAPGTTSGLSTAGSTLGGTRQQDRGGAQATLIAREQAEERREGRPPYNATNGVQGARSGITGTFGQHRLSHGTERNLRPYDIQEIGRPKSKMLLPHRYAIGCEDGAADPEGRGWVMRSDLVWWKKNGLPESVRDRMRDQHEYLFHLTKEGTYYAAIDELREEYDPNTHDAGAAAWGYDNYDTWGAKGGSQALSHVPGTRTPPNPLGKMPGSVLHLANEPLSIPDWLGVDHFAAFPTEIPRRLILGFSPTAICLECGAGRWPVVDVVSTLDREAGTTGRSRKQDVNSGDAATNGFNGEGYAKTFQRATIIGHACDCTPYEDHPERMRGDSNKERRNGTHSRNGMDGGGSQEAERLARRPVREYDLAGWTPPPSRPAIVLDPFSGTGTTAMVARALGRIGIGIDLSMDYCRVAQWRIWDSGHGGKIEAKRNAELQGGLF